MDRLPQGGVGWGDELCCVAGAGADNRVRVRALCYVHTKTTGVRWQT